MNIAEIESRLKELVDQPFDPKSFIFGFIEAFEPPKATLTKLKQGSGNQATLPGDLLWKKNLFFRVAPVGKAADTVRTMRTDPLVKRHAPQFVMATDGVDVYCVDLKADQSLDTPFAKLNDRFDFFLALAGIERYEGVQENQADVKAAGRLAKLYDAILEANPDWIRSNRTHELNLLMTRLLFCFFAEDTGIFEDGLFTRTVMNFSNDDGSGVAPLLTQVFAAMDTPEQGRGGLADYIQRFPYVNGGLFRERSEVPKFSGRARRALRDCGELGWQEINPDIFGSMIQAVVEPGLRGDLGMHYTSVPNIMRVLQPLFLLSLEEECDAAWDSEAKLRKLLDRIYKIRVFDPACGSGNFLIIAYRELRRLENRIFLRLKEIARQSSLPMTGVKLDHFYGIEVADYAAETAKLSMWIAEYQMNAQFKEMFGTAPPALPLKEGGNIVQGNATRENWFEVCPPTLGLEIYIVGNPPYLGRAQQDKEQKADIISVFDGVTDKFKKLDYVACWVLKGSQYCAKTGAQCAFVTTNSICQGEQVTLLWPLVFKNDLEIGFAHQSFKWKNNAANNAGVTCIIVGVRKQCRAKKVLYTADISRNVSNISPYLIEADNTIVVPISNAQTKYPVMRFGNMPADGGNLLLSPEEKETLLSNHPEAAPLVRRLYGSQEFIKGYERWCLWIDDDQLELARSVSFIADRIERSKQMRLESVDAGTKSLAERPHQFRDRNVAREHLIIVPKVSSERRNYISAGLLTAGNIITDLLFGIYDGPTYMFSMISSRLSMVWTAAVGGQLETRLRYSNTLVYNTIPIPAFSNDQKTALDEHAYEILGAREAHPGKTIAWLYDPETMPANLLDAHRALDDTLERIYIGRPFRNDTERLEHLFKLYAAKTNKIKKGAA